ncbi:MAG: class A sortase [Enterococcus sp.]
MNEFNNSAERMLYAATTILPESEMDKGNYTLASHNMGIEGSMFTSLYQVLIGDDIYLKDKLGKEFHYVTKKTDVVNYRDTSCLEEQDNSVITLIICQDDQNTENRLVVQGVLVD